MNLFDLYARITLDTSDYEKGVKESSDGFDKLKGGISKVTKVAAGIGTAVATVSTLLAKAGIEAAAEVRAETSAFQQTFGDMADVATEAIGRVAESSGILQERLNALGSKIYAFARSSGGDVEESMTLMERALTVAADSAAYYDTSVEQATETLQSFLKGNYENDAALGLSATEATRNAEAMELFGKKFQELTEIQKQKTLLSMVEDAQALSGAMGQAAREADGWENVIGNLKKSWQLLQAEMGEPVLDMVTPIVQDAATAVMFLRDNWDSVEQGIENVGIALAALAAGFAAQKLATGFGSAQVAVSLLSMEIGKANLAQAALNGTMTVGQTVVALLTRKMTAAQFAQAAMTKAQTGLNAAMSANPIGLVITAVGLLGVVIHNSISEVDALADSMVVQAQTSEEAEANLEKLRAKFAEFEGNPNKWGEEKKQEYLAVKQAIQETEEQLSQLHQTEMEAATAAAEAATDPVQIFQTATQQYEQDATALYQKFVETYEGIYDKVAGWFGPFQEASTTVETSVEKMMAAMQSQVDFNTAYSANLQELKEYGLGGLSEAFQSYGADGAAYAQAIVAAVEQAGGATTEKGQQIIQGFTDINQKVTESQSELSQTMALLDGEMEAQLQSMTETYADAIADLDKGKEAKAAAETTFQSFLDGMNKKIPGILSAMEGFGKQITSSLQSGIGTVKIPVEIEVKGDIPGYKTGLEYVPYDNYLAYLHKGEAVLTASEAAAWRAGKDTGSGSTNSGSGSGTVTVNQYIDSVPQSPVELASTTAAYFEQARWVT